MLLSSCAEPRAAICSRLYLFPLAHGALQSRSLKVAVKWIRIGSAGCEGEHKDREERHKKIFKHESECFNWWTT